MTVPEQSASLVNCRIVPPAWQWDSPGSTSALPAGSGSHPSCSHYCKIQFVCVHTYPKVLSYTFVPLQDAASMVQLIIVRRRICTFQTAHGAGTFVSTREQKKVARFVPTSGHSALAHLRLTCFCVRSCDRTRLAVDRFRKRRRGHDCTWCPQDGDCPWLPAACSKLWHAQGSCGMAPPEGHNRLQRTVQLGISEAQLWQRVLLGQVGDVL